MSELIVKSIKGSGVPLPGNDIDTDRIIPARFLKCVTFEGIGEHAFEDDIKMLEEKGEIHPFKDETYANGSILCSNVNFGCGSSREHAPQAIKRWGVDAIIAESYSEIFYGNCVSLGVPCLVATHEQAEKIIQFFQENPTVEVEIDIEKATIDLNGDVVELSIPAGPQKQFLDGSWNARSQLLQNLEGVKSLAETLPYVKNYQ